ncbi:DNA polymerase delta subunit 3-like isoform X2 [Dendronephthya gigantea]|uniref:DNA polymerase delta subunit 3-like isoform X2 n=1 Tax=Dendronephthya gigantea TaxID=151771 RepID=UPI00106AC560|nr:DNA polymerase delta subunit 3-like isoform X2 [Dendronephthya gigantea]
MADDEMYLENLKEFVIDEDRIVTYKWLSRTLSVNVNLAKQMLYAFVRQHEKDENLCVIYTVGGLIKDKNGNLIQKYLFSHEKDLQDIKQCYDKITSLHVYSIQKSNPKDSNVLYLADYDSQRQNLDSPNRWSNITLKSITKRNSEIPEEVKSGNENEQQKKPMSNGFQKSTKNEVQVKSTSAPSTSAKNSKTKTSMKKGDVASFFARQTAKNQAKGSVKAVSVKNEKNEEEKENKEKEQKKSDTCSIPSNCNVKNGNTLAKDDSAETDEEKNVEARENDDALKTKVVDKPEEDFETRKSSPKKGKKKLRQTQKQNNVSTALLVSRIVRIYVSFIY